MCNEVAYSKATGLIYSNVEWVNSVDTLTALPPPCERRVSTWTLHGWTAGAETSEREIYLRACRARSSRLPSLPQASRSYVPFAPPASTRSLLMPTEQGRSTPGLDPKMESLRGCFMQWQRRCVFKRNWTDIL